MKDEDAKIVEWAFGDKSVAEVFDSVYGHSEDEDGFPSEFANGHTVESIDRRRLTLLADLIGNEKVSLEKRGKLLSALYMRLYDCESRNSLYLLFPSTPNTPIGLPYVRSIVTHTKEIDCAYASTNERSA